MVPWLVTLGLRQRRVSWHGYMVEQSCPLYGGQEAEEKEGPETQYGHQWLNFLILGPPSFPTSQAGNHLFNPCSLWLHCGSRTIIVPVSDCKQHRPANLQPASSAEGHGPRAECGHHETFEGVSGRANSCHIMWLRCCLSSAYTALCTLHTVQCQWNCRKLPGSDPKLLNIIICHIFTIHTVFCSYRTMMA